MQKTAFSLVKSRLALGSPGCLVVIVCHHAENGWIHRKITVYCDLMIKSWPDPNSLLHRSTLVLLNLTWHIYKDAVQGGRARQPFVEPKNALKVVFSRFCCTQIKFATIAPFCAYLTISSRLKQKEYVFGSNMDKRRLPSKHLIGQLDPLSVTWHFLHLRRSAGSPCCRAARSCRYTKCRCKNP